MPVLYLRKLRRKRGVGVNKLSTDKLCQHNPNLQGKAGALALGKNSLLLPLAYLWRKKGIFQTAFLAPLSSLASKYASKSKAKLFKCNSLGYKNGFLSIKLLVYP